MIPDAQQQRLLTLASFCLILLLAWLCYRPAVGGGWQLDDRGNLADLAYVEDTSTAIDFVLDGSAGPVGRPLALLTFAAQADSYAAGPVAFLRFNVLLHLLNAVLLAWMLYQLARARQVDERQAGFAAAAAAGAWVLLPLLATATLLVVQRMTTLSAFFMLLGLGTYLLARARIESQPGRALAGMSASLVLATVLATLCKESGILLPVLALAMEATLLRRPERIAPARWRLWQGLFLWLPCAAIVGYLATIPPYPEALELRRGFSAWERVLTQMRLLWVYLFKGVVGLPANLGIFQPSPVVSHSLFEPLTLLASVCWTALATMAVVWRRRYPLAAFAVLWFLGAHLVESTVVPLELYFEHRNYVAVAAPLFALASATVAASARVQRAALAVFSGFLLLNAYFLYSFASLWGEPSLASRYWALRYPDSIRAVTAMATYQLDEEGPLRTLRTIDQFVLAHPEHAYLRLQELNLLCLVAPEADHRQVVEELQNGLSEAAFTYTASGMLSQLFDTAAQEDCRSVDTAAVARLAATLRDNRRYAGDGRFNQFYHKLLAAIARQRGDQAETLEHLDAAIGRGASSELNMMMVTALAGAGDFDAARQFIEDAEGRTPAHPVKALKWRRDLDGLRNYLRELEASEP